MYYILHFLFSEYSLLMLGFLFFSLIGYCFFKEDKSKPKSKPYLTLVHKVTHDFPSQYMITGGQARLVLWCHINELPFPKGYIPRDEDYVKVDTNDASGRRGIIRNEGVDGVDILVVSSIEDYFYKIDLLNNQVIVDGDRIYLTKECLEAFINNSIIINPWQLRKGKNCRFMLLRACIQAGYDCVNHRYYHRYGACSLSENQMREARAIGSEHWYWATYLKKLNQIKNNNH